MNDEDLPNLFIIGAPKCGTTSMFHWLSEHPEICVSKRKETWFFADRELDHLNVRQNHRKNSLAAYVSCFEPVDEFTRIKMEGSTHYLYSEPALNFISGLSPKPRVIVQLRNPAARIWSHFNYIRQQAVLPIDISFVEYVDVLLGRNTKHDGIFTREPWPQHLLENQLSYSNYYYHLSRWYDRIPRDNLRIMVLEDLLRDKLNVAQDVADWIGVDSAYYDHYDFKAVNATRSRASAGIRRYLRGYATYFPRPFSKVAKRVVDNTLGSFKMKKSSADPSAISKLEGYFEAPNQRLRSEFGLDLSSWNR